MRIKPGRYPFSGKLLFREKQIFRQLPFLLMPILLQLLFLWGLIQQVVFGKPWGTKPAGDLALILINLGNLLIIYFIFSIRLEICITDQGISFRMGPVQFRWRNIPWSGIQSARLIRYDGIRDYLGYGLRYSRRRGWCYTISGTDGLELILIDQSRILLGTWQKKELAEALKKKESAS
jgi:hypothetical protein